MMLQKWSGERLKEYQQKFQGSGSQKVQAMKTSTHIELMLGAG